LRKAVTFDADLKLKSKRTWYRSLAAKPKEVL